MRLTEINLSVFDSLHVAFRKDGTCNSAPVRFHPRMNRRIYRLDRSGEIGEPCGMPRLVSRLIVVRFLRPCPSCFPPERRATSGASVKLACPPFGAPPISSAQRVGSYRSIRPDRRPQHSYGRQSKASAPRARRPAHFDFSGRHIAPQFVLKLWGVLAPHLRYQL
jgi:hypothetical protein